MGMIGKCQGEGNVTHTQAAASAAPSAATSEAVTAPTPALGDSTEMMQVDDEEMGTAPLAPESEVNPVEEKAEELLGDLI